MPRRFKPMDQTLQLLCRKYFKLRRNFWDHLQENLKPPSDIRWPPIRVSSSGWYDFQPNPGPLCLLNIVRTAFTGTKAFRVCQCTPLKGCFPPHCKSWPTRLVRSLTCSLVRHPNQSIKYAIQPVTTRAVPFKLLSWNTRVTVQVAYLLSPLPESGPNFVVCPFCFGHLPWCHDIPSRVFTTNMSHLQYTMNASLNLLSRLDRFRQPI